MKSLEVCDSTQNDDDKESGREREGQEKKTNGKEDLNESLNSGDEDKSSDIGMKSESVENESRECLETRDVENDVNGRDGDSNGDSINSGGQTDETTPTSTDERRLMVVSEDELKYIETDCKKECTEDCNVVSGSVNCSKEPGLNVEIESLDLHNWEQSQELKEELMDVDSPCGAEDPYKDVKSIIETSPMQCFKEEENSSDNTIVDKDVQDVRGFDIDEDTILDLDCDKENKKNVEDSDVNGFSETDKGNTRVSLEGSSSECGIRVGECQTISGSDKDFLWSENELKKCQDSEGNSGSTVLGESNAIHRPNVEETGEKSANTCSGEDEVVAETDEENQKETESNIIKSGKIIEEDLNESYSNKTDSDGESGKCSKTLPQGESVSLRKRKKSVADELAAESKKKKSESNDVAKNSGSEGESGNDSSPSIFPLSGDAELTTVTDQCETERASTKRALVDTNSKKSKPSGEEMERLNTQETVASSFLANLRGTLKNLTRSDLEELIVQKLCEVITERSTVGQLRRRAQALEENQERWRNKVQVLTKQMREMEMVMKKYMAEVQKQVKENTLQVVAPIKVTRSVGLQVSFYSSSSKPPKLHLSPNTSNAAHHTSAKNSKAGSTKLLPHFTSIPSPRNNKSGPSPQKSQPPRTPPSQAKKTVITRSDSGSLPHKGPSPVNVNRMLQNQFSGPGIKINYKAPPTVQLPQQQNGSKVIDLTEDDDKQPGIVAKQLSPIKVVNHLQQQPQAQVNGRFTYFLPKTSSPGTGTSSGQSRPVLIATPTVSQQNRPMMCPMPPLLFKGGNVGSGSQPQAQNNRLIVPKTLRHPAPLPQPPAYHIARKNVKLLPPRPALKISKVQTGIVLSWNMTLGPEHAPIASYQLYAYQESNSPPTTSLWKKVGDVKALPLPMACTLTQFMSGHKYHFAVRAVDHLCRLGPFSFPGTIVLVK